VKRWITRLVILHGLLSGPCASEALKDPETLAGAVEDICKLMVDKVAVKVYKKEKE